jgi:hypothetical protein
MRNSVSVQISPGPSVRVCIEATSNVCSAANAQHAIAIKISMVRLMTSQVYSSLEPENCGEPRWGTRKSAANGVVVTRRLCGLPAALQAERSLAPWRLIVTWRAKTPVGIRPISELKIQGEEPACPLARVKHGMPSFSRSAAETLPSRSGTLCFCARRLSRRVDPGCRYVPTRGSHWKMIVRLRRRHYSARSAATGSTRQARRAGR